MGPLLIKSAAAIAAVAGLAFASADELAPGAAYGDAALSSLTQAELADHALRVFERADRNGDQALDVDEYTALSVVTAELAQLNGFIAIETEDEPSLIALPGASPSALSRSEHIRINAVAQHAFYAYAGGDGRIDADEFVAAQSALFNAADRNGNGMLKRRELGVFAQRQASQTIGA
jgi:EF hand